MKKNELKLNHSYLYHATSRDQLRGIMRDGLKARTYLGTEDICEYYADVIADEGSIPVILRVDMLGIEVKDLSPDIPGIVEPITVTLRKSEEEIAYQWGESEKDWAASLDIVGSIMTEAVIPPLFIDVLSQSYVPRSLEYNVMFYLENGTDSAENLTISVIANSVDEAEEVAVKKLNYKKTHGDFQMGSNARAYISGVELASQELPVSSSLQFNLVNAVRNA